MSSSITITVDGQSKQVEADQRPTHLFADNPKVVVAKINGEIRDLWTELKDGDQVEAIEIGSAICPCCGYTTHAKSVRKQLGERRGGTDD